MAYVFKDRKPPEEWSQFKARARSRFLIPFYAVSWLADWAAHFLAKWPMVELLEYLGSFSILFAVIFYFADAPNRLKQKHYQAWQVINTAAGKGGNGGRIDALQELNEDHVALIGVDVADAYLEGLRLEKAEARRANFSGTDLRGANFEKADLEDSYFNSANLRGASLAGCSLARSRFENADLNGATLAGADLADVSFQQADLRKADFAAATNWQSITNFAQANILGLRNAPAGFAEWARKKGAIEDSQP